MVKSMTGYGMATFENDLVSIQVEIKALNSKFLDLTMKIPKETNPYENELRKIISDVIVRGKLSCCVDVTSKSGVNNAASINLEVFEHYRKEFEKTSLIKGLITNDVIIDNIMKLPDVLQTNSSKSDLLDKEVVIDLIKQALDNCDQFRIQEGKSIYTALNEARNVIQESLEQIIAIDHQRVESIKNRIHEHLNETIPQDKIDKNRYEQEIIYYIEKLDISEEIVRLKNHLSYFDETLNSPTSQGKKLGFISQEIGREINTIGSKANDATMQKFVVEMKDNLEKIKEQILNIV